MVFHYKSRTKEALAHFYSLYWIPASMKTNLDSLLDSQRDVEENEIASIIRSGVQNFPS